MWEMEILWMFKLQYLVECYGVFDYGGEILFVFEYMDGGILVDVLKFYKKIGECYLVEVMKQVLLGLFYFYKYKIVYWDIKFFNLLFNWKQEVKIVDFGVSIVLVNIFVQCNLFVGMCVYMSFEWFDFDGNGGEYGYVVDIWSFGLILLECVIGRFLCLKLGEKFDWFILMYVICWGEFFFFFVDVFLEFCSFIMLCLQKELICWFFVEMLIFYLFVRKYEGQFGVIFELL